MAVIDIKALEQYLKLDYNVLFIGEHGVGKTAIIKEVFDRAKLRWKYFSASTLDPWVDFVGVPKIIDDSNGNSSLKLIRPDFIQNDEVDALFFDELNRAPDKVINAIMELIQFKSINGFKLKNLKVIWAAINPEDDADTYSVNHLDPAHLDRFHARINVPYKLDEKYLLSKYPLIGEVFINWWDGLPIDIKKMVSPRRLDYTMHAYQNGCRIEDFIPRESNPKKLRESLKSIPFSKELSSIMDQNHAHAFLKDSNNMIQMLELIKNGNKECLKFFKDYGKELPKEIIEPFLEAITAQKSGMAIITSLKEFIDKLPSDKGNSGTAAIINEADFVGLCSRNSSTLDLEFQNLASANINLVKKLSQRMIDVLLSCKTDTLMRICWGVQGQSVGIPSNFLKILDILGKLNAQYRFMTINQIKAVNNKLYDKRLVLNTRQFIQEV